MISLLHKNYSVLTGKSFFKENSIWYKNWDAKNGTAVLSIECPQRISRWRKELINLLSGKDSPEGINKKVREYMSQERSSSRKRNKMKYVDFKGREWSVEKGDWISYQMLDKHNQQSLFNKSKTKKFFYIIFLALLTAYFWLA